jgi:hypothetical protein
MKSCSYLSNTLYLKADISETHVGLHVNDPDLHLISFDNVIKHYATNFFAITYRK